MRPVTIAFCVGLLASGCDGGDEPSPLGGDPDGGVPAGEGLPCDVDEVMQICRQCHLDPPKYGAPMALMSWDDTQAPAKSDSTRRVWELMRERINDPADPMPPTGDLSDEDRATLNAWLDSGAPENASGTCDEPDPLPEPDPIGPAALPCEPTHTFTTHAAGSEDPFHVPAEAANLYECFTFRSPFDGTMQGTAWAPIVDDDRVLHHWILYRTATEQPDGGVAACSMPQDATFIAGWAPGGGNFVMPDDVGLELPGPDDSLILQVHYHNVAGYTDADDGSGVALCTTGTPRVHDAGIYTLGTWNIAIPPGAVGYQASGMCGSLLTSFLPEPVHMIASFPHMHERGVRFRTEIMRGSNVGPAEALVEVEHFSFDSQTFYPHDPPVEFRPRDAIRTTCTYDNPSETTVRFGERTEDEMCFNFVLLYPISLFPNGRTCL